MKRYSPSLSTGSSESENLQEGKLRVPFFFSIPSLNWDLLEQKNTNRKLPVQAVHNRFGVAARNGVALQWRH